MAVRAGGRRLVIVESPTKATRSRATSATATSSSRAAVTSATCRPAPPRSPPSTRARSGPAPASTSTTTSSRSTSSRRTRRPRCAPSRTRWRKADELLLATDDDREGEAIAWHLLQELKPKVPARRMVFHEITPKAIADAVANLATSTTTWSTPRRPAASSTGSTATRSRRCCGRRSCPGCRPGACSPWPPGWWSSGNASGSPSATASYWDLDAVLDAGRRCRAAAVPGPADPGRRAPGRAGPRLRQPRPADHQAAQRVLVHLDEAQTRALASSLRHRAVRGRSASTPSPTPASRTRRSAPRRCSRRPAASSASPRSGRCRWRRTSTRAASSPTCVPTRRCCPTPRSTRRARRSRQLFGADYLPDARGSTPTRCKNAQEAHEAVRPAGRHVPHPGPDRAAGRPVPALRADLDAHHRLADEGRRGLSITVDHASQAHSQARAERPGTDGGASRCTFVASGPHHHVPRLPQGLRRVDRRARRQRRRRPDAAAASCARASRCDRSR